MSRPVPLLPPYTSSRHGQQKPYLVPVTLVYETVSPQLTAYSFTVVCVPDILERITVSCVMLFAVKYTTLFYLTTVTSHFLVSSHSVIKPGSVQME